MASPKLIADFTTQLSSALAVGGTSATILSNTDDDGVALPTGLYYFTLDGQNSNKEHISCTNTAGALTAIKSVSRQGVEVSGAARAHRVGCSVVMTDWATYKSYIDAATIAGISPATTSTLGGVNTTTDTASSVVVSTDDSRLVTANIASAVLPYIYPIGSIYTATVSTNPSTLLGFGTWSAFGAGRVMIGAGTGTKVATFASRSSNVITVTGLTNAANNEFQTGQLVAYSAPSGAMTGLTSGSNYYLVRTGNLTFSLASSLANAQNGTVISLSSDGSGTQTFTLTLTTRTGGDTGGEENHAMSSTELLAHVHSAAQTPNSGGSYGGYQGSSSAVFSPPNPNTGSTGGNAAMNVMQPFISVYIWTRTA